MAHLRAGQLDVAERRLRESLEAGPGWHARHLNDLGLVLVHHARGDSQQARASYAEAVALMDQRPASYTKIVQDWLEAHLLCREIEQLLGTPDEAKYAEAEQTRTTEDDADRGDQNQPGTEP
jgi:hypothetical protein